MSNYQEDSYFRGLFSGIKSLAIGLRTTMRELFVKKITQEYPENRAELKMFDRFRGALIMPHNEDNEHKCISCHLCEKACPNDTIVVIDDFIEADGKKKKILGRYEYNLGKCMFCMLCVKACPQDAITFDQSFENAVFDRNVLLQQLNAEGSKCIEKKPAPKPTPVVKSTQQEKTETVVPKTETTSNESQTPTTTPTVSPNGESTQENQ